MFAFLSSSHQSCVEHCNRFSCWRQSCYDSAFELLRLATPHSSEDGNLKLCIDESARRIFLSVQRVMADYKSASALLAGGNNQFVVFLRI